MGKFGKMKIGRFDSDCFRIVPEDEGYLSITLKWLYPPVDPMSARLSRGNDEIISRAYDFSNTLKHFAVDHTM